MLGEIVALLLAAGADPGARGDRGRSALHRAAAAGRTVVCRQLAAAGANLEAADEAGCIDSCRALLELSANPRLAGHNGNTALHLAAREGNLAICALLVDAGADPAVLTSWRARIGANRARRGASSVDA